MKQILSLVALLVPAVSCFGAQLTCVKDLRAVDGDLTKFTLEIAANGDAVATLLEEGASPAVSFSESATLRGLHCKQVGNEPMDHVCTGVNQVAVSTLEVFPPPGGNFTHVVNVRTSYKNKSYSFDAGSIGHGPTKDGCDFTP